MGKSCEVLRVYVTPLASIPETIEAAIDITGATPQDKQDFARDWQARTDLLLERHNIELDHLFEQLSKR